MLNHKYGQGMKRQSQAAVGSSTIGSHKSSGSSIRQKVNNVESYNDASQFAYLTSKAAHSGSTDSAFIQANPSEYDSQSRKLDFSFSN